MSLTRMTSIISKLQLVYMTAKNISGCLLGSNCEIKHLVRLL